jgi:Domain of unknown function (DUF4440)
VRSIDGLGISPELTGHCDAYPVIDDHVDAVKVHEIPIGEGRFSMTRRGKELSGDAAQPILDLQHRWVEALVKADTEALDAILVDSYVDTDESGSRFDKTGVLAALKSGDLRLASITLLETHVHRYGDSAVLTGASAQTGSFRGQPIAPKILFTATLVLQNGVWRAAAAHRTAVPDQ